MWNDEDQGFGKVSNFSLKRKNPEAVCDSSEAGSSRSRQRESNSPNSFTSIFCHPRVRSSPYSLGDQGSLRAPLSTTIGGGGFGLRCKRLMGLLVNHHRRAWWESGEVKDETKGKKANTHCPKWSDKDACPRPKHHGIGVADPACHSLVSDACKVLDRVHPQTGAIFEVVCNGSQIALCAGIDWLSQFKLVPSRLAGVGKSSLESRTPLRSSSDSPNYCSTYSDNITVYTMK